MKHLVNRAGSVQDIKNSLHFIHGYTVEELKEALADEQNRQNRSTVVKMLKTAISKKEKTNNMKTPLTTMICAVALLLSNAFKAQSPCDSVPQVLSYSTCSHTFCVPGTFVPNQSLCISQVISGQYGIANTYTFTQDSAAPVNTASIPWAPTTAGVTHFTLSALVAYNGKTCPQTVTWSFTTSVCEAGSPVGIHENKDELVQWGVYPQPAGQLLHIDIKALQLNAELHNAAIMDVAGREVKRFALISEKNVLDVQDLQSGMYLLKIENQQGRLTHFERILKQ